MMTQLDCEAFNLISHAQLIPQLLLCIGETDDLFFKTGFYYMSVSYVPLCVWGGDHSIFFYFQIIEGQWRKINISVVMLMAMGMKCKLTIAVYSLKINYSFYLLYLFLVSTFHHLVPSHIAV